MSIFFTADTHFGHGNIIKYCNRPFLMDADKEALAANGGKWHNGTWKGNRSSDWRISRDAVDKMNDVMTDHINAMVGQDDTLWHLGDFAFAPKDDYYRRCRFYRDRIICQNINIIWGNHDYKSIRDLFKEAYDLTQIHVEGQMARIVLCHYAMAVWDGSHRGNWQLYGHSHSEAEPWMNKNMVGRKSMDVGVDNAAKILGDYRPFTLPELQKILMSRTGFSMDHHIPKNSTAPKEHELTEK